MSDRYRVAAIFDLDGTITRQDTYVAFLVAILCNQPLRLLRAVWLPVAVVLYGLKLRDNSWLKQTFLRAIAGGATQEQVNRWVEPFLASLLKAGIRPGAVQAIRRHHEAGHHLVMVTASFDFYAEELGRRLGFNAVICTRSVWDTTGRLKGELDGENCYGRVKLDRLNAHFGDQRDEWYIIGYSDHHSDALLMEWVDQAVVVNPTARLSRMAALYGYEVQDWEAAHSGRSR